MNIVAFGNCTGFGGAQTAFRRLVDFLVNDGHSVGAIGLVGSGDAIPGTGKLAFEARIATAGSPASKLLQTLAAVRLARKHAPQRFIAVGLASSASLVARCLRRDTFRVCQDFIYGRTKDDPLLVSASRGFSALAMQAPSMILPLKSSGYDALPLSWLPCFPDSPREGFIRAQKQDSTGAHLAYFGRIASNKGIDLLLNALATATLEAPVSVDIWGSGEEAEQLRQLSTSLKLTDRVSFRGPYPEGEAYARLLCSYDGLVLPTKGSEGLPLILLEAMAYGMPLLTTRVGAIPDAADQNPDAVLVDPTLASFRAGLEDFAKRVLTGSFSASRAQSFYRTHFSYEVMASRWRTMLNDPQHFFSNHG